MSKSRDVLFAFLAGAAAGAVLGVLFAPDTGKNTREKLSFQLEKYRDQLQQLLDDMLHEHHTADSAAKAESNKVVDDAKGKAEQLLHDVEALIEEIRTHKNNG